MTMKKINFLFIVGIFVMSLLIASCETVPGVKTPVDAKYAEFQSSQELKKFSSSQEIVEFLRNVQVNAQSADAFGGTMVRRGAFDMAVAESAAPSLEKAADAGAADYSQTNIQVKGVDEADFVKNDGRYIYTLSQDRLVIVDAYPAENAKILSETNIDGRSRNMLVNNDRLVVFAEDNGEVPVFAQYDFVPRPRYTSMTKILVYDISDKSEPKLANEYSIKGYYSESRMIDKHVYFIVRDDVYYYAQTVDMPVIKEASTTIVKPEIYYFDNPEYNYNFHTVASFNIFALLTASDCTDDSATASPETASV